MFFFINIFLKSLFSLCQLSLHFSGFYLCLLLAPGSRMRFRADAECKKNYKIRCSALFFLCVHIFIGCWARHRSNWLAWQGTTPFLLVAGYNLLSREPIRDCDAKMNNLRCKDGKKAKKLVVSKGNTIFSKHEQPE